MRKIIAFLFCTVLAIVSYSQNWEQKASAPGDGRHHPVTFSLDGKGYMVTGSTDFIAGTNDFYEYDPASNSWSTLQSFPGIGRGFSIGDTWNGKAYIGFGYGDNNNYLDDLWEYDPATDNWTELTPCPCAERVHPTFVIEDGLIFVGMGNNDVDGNMNDWWEYNIATDSWRQLPDLPGPERHHPYMFSANGDVFTGFGHGNSPGTNVYNDWYKWDIASETWTQMDDLPANGRVAGTQFSIGDRGFVLSGDGDNHGSMSTGEFWEYDYQTDSWTSLPPHPGVSRWAPGSFTIGNVVYFMAGEVRTGNPNAGLKNDLWSFDLDAIASVKNNPLSELILYPNPAKDMIQIKGSTTQNIASIKILDITGKVVLNHKYTGSSIDISQLNKGIYYMLINQKDGRHKPLKFKRL
ncbi:MAG: kelch repeat-containing protein [Bacteroidota bacterium]